jgi:hypothetical protein
MKRTSSSTTAIRGPSVSLLTSFGLSPSMARRTGLSKPLRGCDVRAGPEGGVLPGLSCAALGCAEGALQGRPPPFEHRGLPARSLARADARTHAFRTLTIVANGSQSDIRGRIRFMRRGSHAVERVA